ncbi:TPA: hypothetical protein EYN65_04040 [Candidatus Poribacteria bacterium]|nr:hypothetical protein [Candidatus Poribacteria bacterium]HIB87925.1 hypothetical protein [Candidatus Poribacteria bacterium]HIO09959.1 hypothetical protein [Candidatus Poribacteria bacterium]HIO48098.1 hypothetical protein [Candidatus Poribacteria bacterium]HIO79075.1 hypothetical protein [Candidatus Poribacteria bacterium]
MLRPNFSCQLIHILVIQVFFMPLTWAHDNGLGNHVLEAYRLDQDQPPKIDGKLGDPVWQQAVPISGFIQLRPDRTKSATEDTEVRVVYDTHHLYIGVRCYDSSPDQIVNRLTRRGDMWSSDNISFFIDPHHDHRTGYKFATTPSGVQNDDYRYEDTRRDSNWRGIWWVGATVDELGWATEFKIPFANFRFAETGEQVWGFDIERVNRRKSEVTVWKQLTQAGPLTRMSDLGHLVGLRQIQGGKLFEVSPYFLGGISGQNQLGQSDGGLDLQYNLAGSLKTNLTFNPDFAQVEADQLKINLSRFPTRFPERRPFFVEGNSFFETPLDLFFSRRIGHRGDILWGTKMTGKTGSYSLGLLSSQTGDFALLKTRQARKKKESALYSAFRAKRDILKRSNVGFLLTTKEQEIGYSRIGGIDMSLALGKTYLMSGQVAQSFNAQQLAGESGRSNNLSQNRAYTLTIAQRDYLWSASASAERIEPMFEINQTGYLRKEKNRGWQSLNLGGSYKPPVGKSLLFFSTSAGLSQGLYTDAYLANWAMEHPDFTLSPDFRQDLITWDAGMRMGVDFSESVWDDVDLFYHRRRVVELTDVFTASNYGFSLETNSALPISGEIDLSQGDFYNFTRQSVGRQRQVALDSILRPKSNFTIEINGSYAQSLTAYKKIDGRFLASSLRLTYLFRRNLFLRIFGQTSRERKNYDQIQTLKNYLVSLLFGWEYSPKSHLFLAYNEDWQAEEGFMRLGNRVAVLKVSYLWNL